MARVTQSKPISRSSMTHPDDIYFDQGANVVDASDLATAITLVNAMKDILIANKLMAADA